MLSRLERLAVQLLYDEVAASNLPRAGYFKTTNFEFELPRCDEELSGLLHNGLQHTEP